MKFKHRMKQFNILYLI